MQAHSDCHRVERQYTAHESLDCEHGAVRHAIDELHHVARIGAVMPAADRHPIENQGSRVDAAANHTLNRFELCKIAEHEVRLNAGSLESLQMLFDETRAGWNGHFAI